MGYQRKAGYLEFDSNFNKSNRMNMIAFIFAFFCLVTCVAAQDGEVKEILSRMSQKCDMLTPESAVQYSETLILGSLHLHDEGDKIMRQACASLVRKITNGTGTIPKPAIQAMAEVSRDFILSDEYKAVADKYSHKVVTRGETNLDYGLDLKFALRNFRFHDRIIIRLMELETILGTPQS